jgi:uracil-DNA glycosylase family 4
VPALVEPDRDCPHCPRLVAFRGEARMREQAWHNAPVPAFGALDARLLIVGLAPGLRGANRTGRPFTGDFAGDTLYAALLRHGFARGSYGARPDDGLTLVDCRVTNGVRCVPPENKPTPTEIKACRPFLDAELKAMGRLRLILALGRVAHTTVLARFGLPAAHVPFRHGAIDPLPGGIDLAASYHCSRYNTNTGRLTEAMFDRVIGALKARLTD